MKGFYVIKNKITLFDKETGKALVIGTEDTFNSNLVLMLPGKNGTLALIEDIEEIQNFLQNGQLKASDSEKLGGKTASSYVLTDMSNINVGNLSPETLNGLKGYTGSQGSKGDTGSGFNISKIFGSLSALLAGTTTEETFAMVGDPLPISDPDYGKLYLRKNNTWNYITDLSVEGAAGIQGPTGSRGYTGSQGIQGMQGIQGYTGSKGATGTTGFVGSKGDLGYTGSKGDTGTISTGTPSGGINGDTWYQY